MRTGILGQVTRHLATRFEDAARAEADEGAVPVFVCHPHEAIESTGGEEGNRAAGVLYLFRIGPEPGTAQRRGRLEPAIVPGASGRIVIEGPWLRLRYAFLVVGGTSEDELEILAAIIADLNREPWLEPIDTRAEKDREPGEPPLGVASSESRVLRDVWPLRLVEAPETWREIGLEEHRLAVVFELTLTLPGPAPERIEPVLERELRVATTYRSER